MNVKKIIARILAENNNGPEFLEFYSPAYGKVFAERGKETLQAIDFISVSGKRINLNDDMTFVGSDDTAEIMLYPSERERDWKAWFVKNYPNQLFHLSQIVVTEEGTMGIICAIENDTHAIIKTFSNTYDTTKQIKIPLSKLTSSEDARNVLLNSLFKIGVNTSLDKISEESNCHSVEMTDDKL